MRAAGVQRDAFGGMLPCSAVLYVLTWFTPFQVAVWWLDRMPEVRPTRADAPEAEAARGEPPPTSWTSRPVRAP
jgi:hypothetical protein